MRNRAAQGTKTIRLPQLAAMMLFFLGLTTNSQLDAATAWTPLQPSALQHPHAWPQAKNDAAKTADLPLPVSDDQIHVLSPRDATLYREAFAAQERADWQAADAAMIQIKDKRLVGHVMADRYLRRAPTLAEAQEWLTSYGDLPEAADIYDSARKLRGFAAAHIARPAATVNWSGNNGQISSSGFRGLNDNEAGVKNHVASKINAALRHGDPLKAREIMTTEMQRGTLSVPDAHIIISHIAASFFYDGEIERAHDLAHVAASSGVPLGLWIDGLSAWKQQDYQEAARSFASLAQAPGLLAWDHAAASYWAYRAAKRIGDEPQAHHWLAEAAKAPRSFYGYMAASQIAPSQPNSSWKMPELNAKNTALLASRAAGWQALALVQASRNDLAEAELRRLAPSAARDVQTATLALAEKAHMTALTLQLGGIATNDNGQLYEAAQYPLPVWQPTSGFKVDRALIYALARHESHFDPDAVSQSGACGLMQIMPSTARGIANDNEAGRASSDCPDRLFDPATNLDLGQKYVRVLAGQPMIGDNLLLLLAAYNGGPGNLAHWLDGEDRADPMLFMESLPVRETRDYVQQVLLQYWMYRARLSEPQTSVAQLARGEWPRYALRDDGVKQAMVKDIELASAAR